jgi:hypothetical protein
MYTQYLLVLPTSCPLPLISISQIGPVLPSYSLIFGKEKNKRHFCLFKITIQGVSL